MASSISTTSVCRRMPRPRPSPAVSPNVEPGDYTVTATAPGTTCVSNYDARANAEGGWLFRLLGYTSFGFLACSAGPS